MTTPLTPPTFGDKYSTPLTDIGSGYAAGITSAGQSIAGAIGAVMGGINQKTGEVQPGILDQKKSSEDMLDMMFAHGMMKQDEYEKAKSSGLGAQQKWIGQSTAEFNTKLQAQLEQQKALAVTAASEQGAMARQQFSGGTTIQAEQMRIDAEKAAAALKQQQQPGKVLQEKSAPTPVPSFLPKLGLDQSSNQPAIKLFGQ